MAAALALTPPELRQGQGLPLTTTYVRVPERAAHPDYQRILVEALVLPRTDYGILQVDPENLPATLKMFDDLPVRVRHGDFNIGHVTGIREMAEGLCATLLIYPPGQLPPEQRAFARKVGRDIAGGVYRQCSISFAQLTLGSDPPRQSIAPVEISICTQGKLEVGDFKTVYYSSDRRPEQGTGRFIEGNILSCQLEYSRASPLPDQMTPSEEPATSQPPSTLQDEPKEELFVPQAATFGEDGRVIIPKAFSATEAEIISANVLSFSVDRFMGLDPGLRSELTEGLTKFTERAAELDQEKARNTQLEEAIKKYSTENAILKKEVADATKATQVALQHLDSINLKQKPAPGESLAESVKRIAKGYSSGLRQMDGLISDYKNQLDARAALTSFRPPQGDLRTKRFSADPHTPEPSASPAKRQRLDPAGERNLDYLFKNSPGFGVSKEELLKSLEVLNW